MPWPDFAFAAALIAILAAIAVVDFRDLIIPDPLNLVLALTGFAYAALEQQSFPVGQVVFAVLMLAGFWLVRAGFHRFRGVAGLGLGDVKMAGAASFWFSPWNLPLFLFATAFSALVFVTSKSLATRHVDKLARIPFGPFLGFGLFVTWALERSAWQTFIPDRGF
jgi:leader peptidase (prepilin peptidase)/N-methyltransferase